MAKKIITPLEDVLRINVQHLLKEHFEGKPGQFAARVKNVRLSRIQEIAESGACTIATLGRVAQGFGLKPYQLLVPDLDVKDPQVVVKGAHAKFLEEVRKGVQREENEEGGN